MDLEHRLGEINADRDNVSHGMAPLSCGHLQQPHHGTQMPRGEPSTASKAVTWPA
jgi:hypothetical protein